MAGAKPGGLSPIKPTSDDLVFWTPERSGITVEMAGDAGTASFAISVVAHCVRDCSLSQPPTYNRCTAHLALCGAGISTNIFPLALHTWQPMCYCWPRKVGALVLQVFVLW